jgi:uncharacterized membrane protein
MRFRRNIVAGLLAIVPLWFTFVVMSYLVNLLIGAGRPTVNAFARRMRTDNAFLSDLLMAYWFQSTMALLLVLITLYLLGILANAVVGRRMLYYVDRTMEYVPLAKTVYSATRTLMNSLQHDQKVRQRVVLIEFPSRDMRAIGFVTATFTASDTGEEVAAVYVPTTPNPTSGYVEIVPSRRLVWLDWSANDAMAFIVSGGSLTPGHIRMNPEATPVDRV